MCVCVIAVLRLSPDVLYNGLEKDIVRKWSGGGKIEPIVPAVRMAEKCAVSFFQLFSVFFKMYSAAARRRRQRVFTLYVPLIAAAAVF